MYEGTVVWYCVIPEGASVGWGWPRFYIQQFPLFLRPEDKSQYLWLALLVQT